MVLLESVYCVTFNPLLFNLWGLNHSFKIFILGILPCAVSSAVIAIKINNNLGFPSWPSDLRIYPPMQGTWIQYLVKELRSHMPQSN